jgi:parallel beta-helix repeat protein
MGESKMRKIITLVVMLLFLGMAISSTGLNIEKQSVKPLSSGNTLYVGGNGTGNYSKIQDAINDSSDGDTVFVYDDSSPYYENLDINTSIKLIGEDRDTTIINGSNVDDFVINITADGIFLSGFTLEQYEDDYRNDTIINIKSSYNTIKGNILTGNTTTGIFIHLDFLYGYNNNNISDNIITGNIWTGISTNGNYSTISNNSFFVKGDGIMLTFGESNQIIYNTFDGCYVGVLLLLTKNTYIYRNKITNTFWGISDMFFGSVNTTYTQNEFSYNHIGLFLSNSINTEVTQNNFIGNNHSAYFFHMLGVSFLVKEIFGSESLLLPKIHWDGNYWDEPKLQQFIIPGFIGIIHILYNIVLSVGLRELPINWVNFDWHPASEPYDIGV